MSRALNYVPRVALFLAGVAAGAISNSRRERSQGDPAATAELKSSIAGLEARIAKQESAAAQRFLQIETKLEEHTGQLAAIPSTAQIVSAMEQLLSKTMTSLDDRLTTQAHSIEVLKSTVCQTDSLLERVLEALDSLQAETGRPDFADDPILSRPAV